MEQERTALEHNMKRALHFMSPTLLSFCYAAKLMASISYLSVSLILNSAVEKCQRLSLGPF